MDDPSSADARRVVKLLTLLVALTGVLVVGLAIGAALAWSEYRELRSATAVALGRESSAREVLEEMSARQQAASAQLASMVRDAERQTAQFEKRAAAIRDKGGGPIDSAEKALDIAQLMMDQSLLALKQTTALQDTLAKSSRPFGPEGARDRPAEERSSPDERRSARRPAR